MYSIKLFNNISDVIYTSLNKKRYDVSADATNYHAALVRSYDLHKTEFPPNLVAIARAGAGTNNIDIEKCSEQGIAVFNTPGANANAVKELVLCGMLLSGRKIFDGIEWVTKTSKECDYDFEKLVEYTKKDFVGPELQGKKLGVIGLGAIGVMVANAAHHGLGMEVMGYDPYMSVDAAWNLSRSITHATTLEEIYINCDYISLHLPLIDKTRGIIGETAIATMKENAVVLNFARGPLVDNTEILKALNENRIKAYITDFPDLALCQNEKVIAIPHLGASTPESEENCARMASAQLKDYLQKGSIKNSVNLPDCELPPTHFYRLSIINKNIKNMVGQITGILAKHNYNIDHMVNRSRGAWAYTLLDLDMMPSAECVKQLNDIEGIVKVRVINP